MKKIYTIRDKKIGNFLQPSIVNHETELTRILGELVLKEDHNFGKFPDEYELYYIGTFDEDTGIITSIPEQFILTLNELLPKGHLKQLSLLKKEEEENEQ